MISISYKDKYLEAKKELEALQRYVMDLQATTIELLNSELMKIDRANNNVNESEEK